MENAVQIVVRHAVDSVEIAHVRTLMQEYGEYLADAPGGAASICLKGYETELQGLPEPYGPPGALLLAWVGDRPAGCVALKKLWPVGVTAQSGGDGIALELKRLWVGSEFRGLGLGRLLMAAAIEQARETGADAVYLDTVPAAMPEANRLYESFRFQRVERYNDNPVKDVIFFRLPLTSAK